MYKDVQEFIATVLRTAENFEAPNLDGSYDFDVKPLEAVAEVFETLGRYARYKAKAIQYRLNGEISRATTYERMCDRQYNQLPEWARW